MNNSVRVFIEIVLAIALIIALVLFFNQSNTLTETEDSLANAQETGTSVVATAAEIITQRVNDLNNANATATQSAEIAATSLSQISNDATQGAIEAASELGDIAATGTQSYEDFVAEIDTVASTATQNADMLVNLENSATQFAEESFTTATQSAETFNSQATQYAENSATTAAQYIDAVATSDAINSQLATSVNAAATLEAERDLAQEAINIQATALAGESTEEASESTDFNLVPYEFKEVIVSIPAHYFAVDPANDIDDNIDMLNDLGDEYAVIAQLYEDNAETFIVFAVPEKTTADIVFEAIVIERDTLDLEFEVDLPEYLNALQDIVSDDIEVIESNVTTLNGQEIGKEITSVDVDIANVIRVRYVFKIDNSFYELNFLTTDKLYDENVALFEAIAATFELVE